LRAGAKLIGLDRETEWVTEAARRFAQVFPDPARAGLGEFLKGDATAVPIPDDAVDLVTCQTVLMHLAEPRRALEEMRRVLRPGGLLVCVEPNNLLNWLAPTSLTPLESTESVLRSHELFLRAHRGRMAAGEGDHAVGELIPGWLAELGFVDLDVRVNDRTAALYPPYASAAQQAALGAALAPEREPLRRFFLLGGGREEVFEEAYAECLRRHAAELAAVAAGQFHAAYASHTYVIAGRKAR
jgi:SAM-dependent methyltransferase